MLFNHFFFFSFHQFLDQYFFSRTCPQLRYTALQRLDYLTPFTGGTYAFHQKLFSSHQFLDQYFLSGISSSAKIYDTLLTRLPGSTFRKNILFNHFFNSHETLVVISRTKSSPQLRYLRHFFDPQVQGILTSSIGNL